MSGPTSRTWQGCCLERYINLSRDGEIGRRSGIKSRLRPARVYGVHTPTEPSETSAYLGKGGPTPEPTDLIFPKWQRELFKTILEEQKLRFDREGRPRTAYSLRHTYICLRLMEGADIYQIAKNCRTSVEMIEKYYAPHINTPLYAPPINVTRNKMNKRGKKATHNTQASPQPQEHPDEETDV